MLRYGRCACTLEMGKGRDMAIRKQLHNLTLAEINDEIEALGIDKNYDNIKAARKALLKLVEKGKAIYSGRGNFLNEDAMAKLEEKEAAEAKPKKTKTPKKTKMEMVWLDGHDMIGTKVFTRFGRLAIKAVGYPDGSKDKLKAKLDNGKIVSLNSCRVQAVDPSYRDRYPIDHSIPTPSGKPSIGVDDEITDRLKGSDVGALKAVARENKIEYKWEHLNPGQQRMCIGNKLRGLARKGSRVLIHGHVVAEGGLEDEKKTVRRGKAA